MKWENKSFYSPLESDQAVVSNEDVEFVLPCPSMRGKTKRQGNIHIFL